MALRDALTLHICKFETLKGDSRPILWRLELYHEVRRLKSQKAELHVACLPSTSLPIIPARDRLNKAQSIPHSTAIPAFDMSRISAKTAVRDCPTHRRNYMRQD